MIKKKAMYFLISVYFLLCLCPKIYSQNLYTLADLEVLKLGKNYHEFFMHARDIIPTKRDQYWREMLSSAAIDFVDEKRNYKQYDLNNYQKILTLGNWPELNSDEFFQFKRNSYSLSYFKNCFTRELKTKCRDQMLKYWKTATHDLESSYQMAVLHYGFFPDASGFVYLENVLHQNSDQFYCSKTVVQNILISHLKEEHLYLKGPKERKQFMNNIISKSCWEKVELALKRELIESDPNDARSIFFALNINQALSPGQYHEWMTRYFLQAPPVGELLNLSWNALKALSENYALREQVLKALESQELLPGKVFKSLNTSRSQALAFHLQESFPEYIKLYAMTCLTYLEGKASFPYGNPTPQCHRLFAITQRGSSKLKSLVTVPLRERYLKTVPKNMNSISLREN